MPLQNYIVVWCRPIPQPWGWGGKFPAGAALTKGVPISEAAASNRRPQQDCQHCAQGTDHSQNLLLQENMKSLLSPIVVGCQGTVSQNLVVQTRMKGLLLTEWHGLSMYLHPKSCCSREKMKCLLCTECHGLSAVPYLKTCFQSTVKSMFA